MPKINGSIHFAKYFPDEEQLASIVIKRYNVFIMSMKNNICCDIESQKSDLRPVEGKEADEELTLLTKALGHPARVQILRLLARRQNCICGEIVEKIENLAQSTVSQHLKVLKEAGLIKGEVEGTAMCYCIAPRGLRRLKVLVAGL